MHSRDFASSVVFCIIHHLFLLANLHDIDASAYVGRTPNQQIGLDGRQQFVSGTILQSDIHCDIIRKGLVLKCLDRLVMLDDFSLFTSFALMFSSSWLYLPPVRSSPSTVNLLIGLPL